MDLTALRPFLTTKADADKLIQMLESINSELFKENFSLSDFLARSTSYDLQTIIEKTVQEANVSTGNAAGLRSLLAALKEEITQLPVIHIILAFSPSGKIVSTIHNWFYDNYKKIVLLDISIDKSIIGGSVISFKGRANDYSLSNRIEQIQ